MIELTWTAPAPDPGRHPVTGYRVEWSADGVGWTPVDPPHAGTETNYRDTGLSPGIARYYRVFALSAGGEGPSSNPAGTATIPLAVPLAPTGLTATAAGPTVIELAWRGPAPDPNRHPVTGYRIEWSAGGAGWAPVGPPHAGTGTTYRHTGLRPGATQHYRVFAASAGGEGPASHPVSAATEVPPVILDEVVPGISTTPDNQIVVEYETDDISAPNLFDLDGRTLVFTPDGNGGYSRSVRPLAWEQEIGDPVNDGEEVHFRGFRFDFGGSSWDSFFISRHGLITFGKQLEYGYRRFSLMRQIANEFVTMPTISTLFKPTLGVVGRQHVALRSDRVVVTWIGSEFGFHVHGRPPMEPSRFQLTLGTDGEIRFSYRNISWRDGIVGLFPNVIIRADLIGRMVDESDSEIVGYLDLLDVSFYESNTDAVIVEFTLRDSVPDPPDGESYMFSLIFDVDKPYWSHTIGVSDLDMTWLVHVQSNGRRNAWVLWPQGRPTRSIGLRVLQNGMANRIAILATLLDDGPGISAMVRAGATRVDSRPADDTELGFVEFDDSNASSLAVDLSQPGHRGAGGQSEVFHYRDLLLDSITCRLIEIVGDEFDLFVFHGESRFDAQETGSPWRRRTLDAEGIGFGNQHYDRLPCESDRIKGHWAKAVWIKSRGVLREGKFNTYLFAHEFTHSWTAAASYLRNGVSEPLFDQGSHWLSELSLTAAFPRANGIERGFLMSATDSGWRENADGTFTPTFADGVFLHSWLDLYLMGLAEAREVPDMILLRNLRPVNGGPSYGTHTADKEIVTMDQIIAAEGPRVPSAASSQKDFNAAFVYLVEPGQIPDPAMLRLHRDYRDAVLEHWSESTGGRSRITTRVPAVANRSR